MLYISPSYAKDFHCIADRCRDSCCIGWEIYADADTLEKYETMDGALGADIRKSLSREGCFMLGEDLRCPHLLKSGLCRIICEAGEDALCDICREHPRFYNYFGGVCEWGVGLSCESAARLILSAKNPLCFEKEERDEASEDCDEVLFALLSKEREKMLLLASDEKIAFFQKLSILEIWAEELQNFIENKNISKDLFAFSDIFNKEEPFFQEERMHKYRSIVLSLEPLSPVWMERCERVSLPNGNAQSQEEFSRLLAYFIFRYFLTSAMEGDCMAGMGLAIFSAAWIYALCESEGRKSCEEIAEAAKDFSKETEYSEDNRDAVLDAFSAFNESFTE